MLIHSSGVPSRGCSFPLLKTLTNPPLQAWRRTDLFLCLLSRVRLAAPLQQHVEGVLHAFTQVAGAARRQQGAQFEGFGHSVLVDVRQHVLFFLAAKDDLGVVVVEVDLWEGKKKWIDQFRFFIFKHWKCL